MCQQKGLLKLEDCLEDKSSIYIVTELCDTDLY